MQEMFQNLGRGLDNELDTVVTVLAKRSGEVCCMPSHVLLLINATEPAHVLHGCDFTVHLIEVNA